MRSRGLVVAVAVLTIGVVLLAAFVIRRGDGPAPALEPETSTPAGLAAEVRLASGDVPRAAENAGETAHEPAPPAVERRAAVEHGTIAGRVLRADGEPARGVFVALGRPAAVDDGPGSPWTSALPAGTHTERARLVHAWKRTGDDGSFELDGIPPAAWVLRAEDGPRLAAVTDPLVLTEGGAIAGVVLVLPAEARLLVRPRIPPGATSSGVFLELRALAPSRIPAWLHAQEFAVESSRATAEDDGTFLLGPSEPGRHALGIVLDRALLQGGGRPDPIAGDVVHLLELDLPPGVTEREIDLTLGLPGTIELHLDLGGYEPPGDAGRPSLVTVSAQREGSRVNDRAAFRVTPREPCELAPLTPGTWSLAVFLRDAHAPWPFDLAPPIHVRGSERVRFDARLVLARGSVEMRDAETDAPLEGHVWIARESGPGFQASRRALRAGGNLELVLEPGSYLVTRRTQELESAWLDRSAHARLEWELSGPRDPTLRLPR